MNNITLLIGIRFHVLFRMLRKNGISFGPKYIIRLLILLPQALISSVLTRAERKKFSIIIRDTVIEKPPVFIIGHWRTGTTFLHQLMHLDPQFTTPLLVQTVIPDHFLFSTRYYIPVMKLLMPKKRPMDEVTVSPLAPQEDEFALIRMGSESPMERLVFPVKDKYFLESYNDYIPKGENLECWKQNLLTLYKKISLLTGKQIVSKNPFHTMRISLLNNMFEGARFIYVCRHPFEVVPSTLKMWNTLSMYNSLNNCWKKPGIHEVASVLRSFSNYVSRERKQLGEDQFAEVWFENLEKNPVDELKRIYSSLNLDFSTEFEKNVNQFLISNKNYKKNTYHLTAEEKDLIRSCLAGTFHL